MDTIVLLLFFYLILCRILTRTRKSLNEPDSLDAVDCGHRTQRKKEKKKVVGED